MCSANIINEGLVSEMNVEDTQACTTIGLLGGAPKPGPSLDGGSQATGEHLALLSLQPACWTKPVWLPLPQLYPECQKVCPFDISEETETWGDQGILEESTYERLAEEMLNILAKWFWLSLEDLASKHYMFKQSSFIKGLTAKIMWRLADQPHHLFQNETH